MFSRPILSRVRSLCLATLHPTGVNRNTVIVNRSPQTADRLEKTMNSRSPQTQKCDIQEITEEDNQTPKIYQIQNCGTIYMDSSNINAHDVRMENCSNNVPQVVTCSLFYLFFFPSCLTYSDHHLRIIGNERALHSQSRTVFDGM